MSTATHLHDHLKSVSHIGIHVADLQRSLAFYRDILGLDVMLEAELAEEYIQRMTGYPDATVAVAMVKLPNSEVFLEIIEYRNCESAPVDTRTANPGTAHFCLYVNDLDEIYDRLTSQGVESVSEVQHVSPDHSVVLIIDPDGIRVELLQMASPINPADYAN